MDTVFKALADPNRRRILDLLKKKDMSVTDLQEYFDFTQASLSHHLDVLKRADLVVTERRGQFIIYSLNISVFEEMANSVLNYFKYDKRK
ncbi:MAG: autorepressor SdpR family transcription factor [Patescibacteria group bacterium]|nr:autorepressor SdpR family transcription factor [Patescibacteria group bacterium]